MSDDQRPSSRRPTSGRGLRVGVVPGVTVTKWTRIWAERLPRISLEMVEVTETDARLALDEDRVDMCFVRLPIAEADLHLIGLYQEVPVVIVSTEHPLSLYDEVSLADLFGENVLDPTHTVDAIDLVAGGAGVLLAPHSIARSHSRRDLVYRTVTDAVPTQIALAWRVDHPNELIEDFIGIIRGRTPNSSRSPRPTPASEAKTTPDAARTPRRRPTTTRRRGR